MAQPFQPNLHPDDEQGIPAADPGQGAPETAPGFGIGGEDPDALAAKQEDDEDAGDDAGS